MKAAVIDLYIEQGTDWQQTFLFYSDSAQTIPVDFTGCTGVCKISDLDGKAVAAPVVTFPAPTTGTLVLAMPSSVTTAISVDGAVLYSDIASFAYDVNVIAADGSVSRWLNGSVSISPEVP